MTHYRECPDCEQNLPVDQFYKRADGTPNTYCKECAKARTRNRAAKGLIINDPHHSLIPSEEAVRAQLNKRGIPTLPGKALSHRHGDLIAWGCVPIEVKSSSLINGQFNWGFSPRQRKGIRGTIVILVCNWGAGETSYHVFDAAHPWFYDGAKVRPAISLTPNRSFVGRKNIMTEDEFNQHRDAWHLIEAKYNQVVARLRAGASMTEFLSNMI